jgi:Protein of unknown function (DUF992)
MRGPSITGFAVAILAMMLYATLNAQEAKVPSKSLAHIGFLSCHVASGWGLVFGSSRKLRCTYTPTDKTKASEQYTVQSADLELTSDTCSPESFCGLCTHRGRRPRPIRDS